MKNITEIQKIIKKQKRRYFWKKYSTKENLEKAEKNLEKYKSENNTKNIYLEKVKINSIKKYGGK